MNDEIAAFKYSLLNTTVATRPAMVVHAHIPVYSRAYDRAKVIRKTIEYLRRSLMYITHRVLELFLQSCFD